jgi:hypothetical protein
MLSSSSTAKPWRQLPSLSKVVVRQPRVLVSLHSLRSTLGVRFAPHRNKDIINVIAAVKARCADVY